MVQPSCVASDLAFGLRILTPGGARQVELVPQAPFHIGGPGLPGCGLSDTERLLVQRFEPGAAAGGGYDCMGFFISKFVKTAQYSDDFS